MIDLEVANGTPSPTVDPSVRTILIGHSMGGIVAADALLAITSEQSIQSKTAQEKQAFGSSTSSPPPSPPNFMFPYIQGVLAFDTPYLGISPGVVAHGAESHYKTASSAYSTASEVAGLFGFGGAATTASTATKGKHSSSQKALTAGPEAAKEALAASAKATSTDAAAVPAWQRWGKYAMFAGAAGAVAAGGAAAYLKRDTITESWSWIGSHLEFVGCLMRGEELKTRITQMAKLKQDHSIGFADLITVLGKGSEKPGTTLAGGFVEIGGVDANDQRTFCVTPQNGGWKPIFEGMVNEKASDETVAHMSMFLPRDNPGYYGLVERAKILVVEWIDQGWYESSERKGGGQNFGEPEDGLGGEVPVFVN